MTLLEGFERRKVPTASGAEIAYARKGEGPPLLLLHGYPQTHVMWHKIAPRLAERFTVVCADLRGYGSSSKPDAGPDHAGYSKREMARDQVELMQSLGFARFSVAGHDRGARVTHRMALDYPGQVTKAAVLDICPTLHMYDHADRAFAEGYYHWFFLIQPYDLPERLIGAEPDFYLERKLMAWGRDQSAFDPMALEAYKRAFRDAATIHATCEDYRAAATIDLEHDRADFGQKKVTCPLLALWGDKGLVGRTYDVLAVWRDYAERVEGQALPCGHFLPEEAPEETIAALDAFF